MKTVTVQAYGEYEFSDSWNEQELDVLENAPILYILCGEESKLDAFTATRRDGTPWHMPMDSMAFYSDCGECIAFGYEFLSDEQIALLEMLDIEWSLYERDEDEAAA